MKFHKMNLLRLGVLTVVVAVSVTGLWLFLPASGSTRQEKALQDQLSVLKSHMDALENGAKGLNTLGNELRLRVALPPIDKEVTSAGTGGALPNTELHSNADASAKILDSTMTTLQHLSGEFKIQQQNYDEIINKYEYNKGYFASIPAIKPMEGVYSPDGFGLRMHPVLGIFKTHEGLDIVNDVGTPVHAAGDGVISMAGESGGGYGIVVAINHGYGYETLYAHLSKVLVREGQRVRRGDLIGKSGETGLVSGPHLHYEVRNKGVCRNPVDYFGDGGGSPGAFRKNLLPQ
ncbi:MAG TPA: M23 family metallopeptidase [Bacteroidota bacterium]|jgi:murein DD-endopeptidase MepM/ murein hydrolase activator NlpD|nr:M23 family metallopeptidase [Bacteroidota bacterium]